MTENTGITNSYVTPDMLDQYEFEPGEGRYFFDSMLRFYEKVNGDIDLDMRNCAGDMETLTPKVTMADFDAVRLLTRGFPERKTI